MPCPSCGYEPPKTKGMPAVKTIIRDRFGIITLPTEEQLAEMERKRLFPGVETHIEMGDEFEHSEETLERMNEVSEEE